MHYYQHHIGDFIKATSRLTDNQVMAYLRILWMYYDKDGVVKNDTEQIAFQTGSDSQTVSLIIKTYFEISDGYLKQSRCDKELEGYLNKSKGGKAGADKRWGNKQSDSLPITIPMPTQCDPNANQEPITNNHKKNIYIPLDVDENDFKEYLKVRKKHKKEWTERIENRVRAEGQKLGWNLQQVITYCLEKQWANFEADWVKEKHPTITTLDNRMGGARAIFGDERILNERADDYKKIA
jgi:uncharacterized protein YdaU (DUF1376 family)